MKNISFGVILVYLVISQNVYSQGSVIFDSLSDMTTKRYGMGYTFNGTNIYAFTGGTNVPPFNYNSSSMETYDLNNNTWTEIRSDLIPRRFGSAEYISSQNKIYVFNGWYYGSNPSITYTDTIEIYDVNSDVLSYSNSNPYPVRYAGSAIWNNKIYVFGGANDSGSSNRLYEYDPEIDQWTRLPDMSEAKSTSGRIVEGVLYVFGGFTGITSTRIDAYDIQAGSWTFLGNMPVGASSHATTVSGKYILIVGSYDDLHLLATYDTETNSFSQLTSNMTGRRHAGAITVDSMLYIFGGSQTSASTSALQSLEVANISNFMVSINGDNTDIPKEFILFQNYPNPFNPTTTIQYKLPKTGLVNITIYNTMGQRIKTLLNEQKTAGAYQAKWNGTDRTGKQVASGVYLYRLKCKDFVQTKKMILVR